MTEDEVGQDTGEQSEFQRGYGQGQRVGFYKGVLLSSSAIAVGFLDTLYWQLSEFEADLRGGRQSQETSELQTDHQPQLKLNLSDQLE